MDSGPGSSPGQALRRHVSSWRPQHYSANSPAEPGGATRPVPASRAARHGNARRTVGAPVACVFPTAWRHRPGPPPAGPRPGEHPAVAGLSNADVGAHDGAMDRPPSVPRNWTTSRPSSVHTAPRVSQSAVTAKTNTTSPSPFGPTLTRQPKLLPRSNGLAPMAPAEPRRSTAKGPPVHCSRTADSPWYPR